MPAVPKKKRIRDRATIKACRKPRCEVCGEKAYGGCHHVISVGSGGSDIAENLIQLCRCCHLDKAHGGHYSKRFLFEFIAKRLGMPADEVESTAWALKV